MYDIPSQNQSPSPENQTNEPVTSTPNELVKGNKSSSLLIIFGVLLIFLASFSAYLYIQNQKLKKGMVPTPPVTTEPPAPTVTPDATSGETNINETEYSFKYPDNFVREVYYEGNYKGLSVKYLGSDQVKTDSDLIDGLIIRTLVLSDINKPVSSYAEEMRALEAESSAELNTTVTTVKKVNLGQVEGFQYETTGFGNVKVTFIDLNPGILRVSVLYAGSEEIIKDYLSTADDILSTLTVSSTPIPSP